MNRNQATDSPRAARWDVLVTGGTVIDGTGAPGKRADIAIKGERIAAVAEALTGAATTVLDASGCVVAPGFIDAHSHSDAYLLLEPSAPSKIMQGITTEVVGQCGCSAAPLLGQARMPADWRRFRYPGRWQTVSEYGDLLARSVPAVNVRLFVGHNTLRGCVMGYEPRPADTGEIRRMAKLLDRCLSEGAAGLSSGLAYPPGKYAAVEELVELNRVVAEHGGVYSTHLRNEGQHLAEAVSEQLHIAALAGVPLEISHLKLGGQADPSVLDQALSSILRSRSEGHRVAADAYPYTASSTDLDIILPDYVYSRGPEHEMSLLWNAESRRRIVQELETRYGRGQWEDIVIATTLDPENERFRGRSLAEVAETLGKSPAEAAIQLLITDRLTTQAIFTGLREEDVAKVLGQEFVSLGTDASLRSPQGMLGQDHPHPRAYGTFPRFLRMCREGLLPLPEAVRKVTSLPAQHFGLVDRGTIAPGHYADLVVFDPEAVTDMASYQVPHRFPRGIRAVVVNGVVTVHHGQLTGQRGGRFLPLHGD